MNEDISERLGKIVIDFQILDSCVDYAIHGLLTLPLPHTEMILAEMSFRNKINLLSSLCLDILERHQDLINSMQDVIKKINEWEADRNRLLHSTWLAEFRDVNGQVIRTKNTAKKKGLKYQRKPINAEKLDELIKSHQIILDEFNKATLAISIRLDRHHMSPLIAHDNNFSYQSLLNVINENYK